MRYNKLVRDKIPEIIEAEGNECETKYVFGLEKLDYLLKKLMEESNELKESKSIEELADVQEVVNAIADELGISQIELENARKEKYNSRGGFKKGIVLIETNENNHK